MAGTAPSVFPNAVTDPACLVFPAQPSGVRIGWSSAARAARPIVPPGTPAGLSASVAGRNVVWTWSPPVAGAPPTSYVLEVGTASGRSDLTSADTGSATPAVVATAVASGTYFVRIRARNASGTSSASNETRLVVGGADGCATVPGAPSGLMASVNGSDVTLTWQAPGGVCPATSYILEAGSSSGLTNLATLPTGSTSTTFSTSGVPAGTYFVRVRSDGAAGTSTGTSNEVSFTIGAAPCASAPGAPTTLAAVTDGSTVSLSWVVPASGCTPSAYFLEAGSAPGLSDLAATSTGSSAPSFVATAVPNGTYYVRVRSENAAGRSNASNEVTVVVGGTSSGWVAEGVRLTNATTGFSGVLADTSTLRLTDGRFRMFMFSGDAYRSAVSSDGLTFTMESGTRLPSGSGHIRVVRLEDGRVRAFYISHGGIASAISSDEGVTFTVEGDRISASTFGASQLSGCVVVRMSDGRWRMYFSDLPVPGAAVVPLKIYSASSSDMLTWTADTGVRIGPGATLSGSGEHPAAWVNGDGSVTLFYFRNSTLGFLKATAADGLTFASESSVGLSPANDPDVVQLADGSFRMYYNWGDNTSGAIYSARHAAGSLAN